MDIKILIWYFVFYIAIIYNRKSWKFLGYIPAQENIFYFYLNDAWQITGKALKNWLTRSL